MELVNEVSTEDFCRIQESVGFGTPSREMVKKALKNTPYLVGAKVDGEIIGMGRVVGDMAKIAYIQDLFIMPDFQGQGIGQKILQELLCFIEKEAVPGSTIRVGLMAAVGKEDFYIRNGFHKRPNEKEGCGMMKLLQIP